MKNAVRPIISVAVSNIFADNFEVSKLTALNELDLLPEFRVHLMSEIIQYYNGSCDNLSEDVYAVLMCLDSKGFNVFDELDNIMFRCEICGWWCDTSELSHSDIYDSLCTDCEGNE